MRRILLSLAILGSLGGLTFGDSPSVRVHRTEKPAAPGEVLDEIASPWRPRAKPILDKATIAARGPLETFACKPEQYAWLLDHPDRAVAAWRRIGAKCVSIQAKGPGEFFWTDEHGSDLVWYTVAHAPGLRIWLAEGKVRPGQVLPSVPGKAVVVLRYQEVRKDDGLVLVQHQCDLYVQTDNVTAALVGKLVGGSANRFAEQGIGNMQTFFSALSWYLERHPERVAELLRPES